MSVSVISRVRHDLCESCQKVPATVLVAFGDGEPFAVCPACAPVYG